MTGDENSPDPFTNLYEGPARLMQAMFAAFGSSGSDAQAQAFAPEELAHWTKVGTRLNALWLEIMTEQARRPASGAAMFDPARWMDMAQGWFRQMPLADPARQKALWDDSLALWQTVLAGHAGNDTAPALPRADKRFADERWRAHPVFALIHQTYLLLAERAGQMVDELDGLPADQREKLRFTTKAISEAASPANVPFLNPIVIERTLETRGENLIKGMEHLLADLKRGQLTHTDGSSFVLGETIAATPGKVVHETRFTS